MNDRELLDKAAKAAGIRQHRDGGCEHLFLIDNEYVEWNPLTDDGDALRLAVKLLMEFNCGTHATAVGWEPKEEMCLSEPHGTDRYAATRRAIVRAAAEIGKEIP